MMAARVTCSESLPAMSSSRFRPQLFEVDAPPGCLVALADVDHVASRWLM